MVGRTNTGLFIQHWTAGGDMLVALGRARSTGAEGSVSLGLGWHMAWAR